MTTATAPLPGLETTGPIPWEILEERFRGLMRTIVRRDGLTERTHLEDNSRLFYRLDRALEDLVYGMLQNDLRPTAEAIVMELQEILHLEVKRLVRESDRADFDAKYDKAGAA